MVHFTFNRKYKEITNRKQRDEYQNEIDQIYDEYIELHAFHDVIANQYQKFEHELSSIKDETSKEFHEKRNRVLRDYLEKQNDPDYLKKRERYAQIYTKLNFIHDLCKKYDCTL